MSDEAYKIDKIDREILRRLLIDSRKPFQEIARELIVSGGTIHVRTNKNERGWGYSRLQVGCGFWQTWTRGLCFCRDNLAKPATIRVV